jgi:WD40 repeat protein
MAAANPAKLKLLKDFSTRGTVFRMARVPTTSRFFVGGADFKVYEVDLSAPKIEFKELGAHESYVNGLALAGKTLVSGGYDGRLIWWDTQTRARVRSVEAHAKWIRNVVAAPDGSMIASVADDMVCRLWDTAGGKLLRELRGHQEKTPHHFPSMLYACAFSPDGKYVATGDKVGHIVVWEAASGKSAATLEAPGMYTWDPVQRRHSIGGIRTLAFSPDGRLLAAGGIGRIGNIDHLDGPSRVEVFDWAKGQRTHEFSDTKFKGLIECLRFHPEGAWLAAGGGANDGFLTFYDLTTSKIVRQEKVSMHVHDLALGDGADVVYAAGHGKIAVFEMKG